MQTLPVKMPLLNRVNSTHSSFAWKFMLVVLGNLFLIASAKLNIPLMPVPVTMQTFAVLFIGMIYGWQLGSITILSYLFEGICGLPVFAASIPGIAALFAPTGGYLVGFVLAAVCVGYLTEKGLGDSKLKVFLVAILGNLIIYSCGLITLSKFVGFQLAVQFGVKPFLLIDFVKIILLAATVPFFWHKNLMN